MSKKSAKITIFAKRTSLMAAYVAMAPSYMGYQELQTYQSESTLRLTVQLF